MATGPSKSTVTCFNCMGFLVFDPRLNSAVGNEMSKAIFDFYGALVHCWNTQNKMETPMSIFDLSGRVAIITGGNGGIGLGIAQALAASGCGGSIWGPTAAT